MGPFSSVRTPRSRLTGWGWGNPSAKTQDSPDPVGPETSAGSRRRAQGRHSQILLPGFRPDLQKRRVLLSYFGKLCPGPRNSHTLRVVVSHPAPTSQSLGELLKNTASQMSPQALGVIASEGGAQAGAVLTQPGRRTPRGPHLWTPPRGERVTPEILPKSDSAAPAISPACLCGASGSKQGLCRVGLASPRTVGKADDVSALIFGNIPQSSGCLAISILFVCFKILLIFRQRGREKWRERNINMWLPLSRPPLGT